MNNVTYIENFIPNSQTLFNDLIENIDWDKRMKARLTASFGVAYNYSQISYPFNEMPKIIADLCKQIETRLNFLANNCLINYYPNGKSRMGFHSDQTDMLAENTGIAIVSLGETRTLKFRKIDNYSETFTVELTSGSLVYMTQKIQKNWQHSIPKSDTENGRISLTFRSIKTI